MTRPLGAPSRGWARAARRARRAWRVGAALLAWRPRGLAAGTDDETRGAWQTVAGTGRSGFGGSTYQSSRHDFAVETRLNSPWGLALDTDYDRLYVSDTVNNVIRSVDLQTGLMEVIAGSEWAGDSGDYGPAVAAELNMPMGLALDMPGRVLYVADTSNNRVRAVSLDLGRVYQAEANGSLPVGDGGGPANVVIRGAQGRYFCPPLSGPGSQLNVTPLLLGSEFCSGSTGSGFVTYLDVIDEHIDFHVQGQSGPGEYELRFRYSDRYDRVHASGDRRLRLLVNGQVRTHALVFWPTGRTQAGRRDVYEWVTFKTTLAFGENVVRLELAGRGGPQVDHLYVVPPRPPIWTVAGTGVAGPRECKTGCLADFPSERDATLAQLNHPVGLAVDAVAKILYIADTENGRVLRLDTSGGTISTIVGGQNRSSTRDGEVGGAVLGKLFRPSGLFLDSARRYLYIVDSVEGRVRRVDLAEPTAERTVVTISGFGRQQAPFEHLLRTPQAITLDEATGTLFVSDRDHGRVRSTTLAGGTCPLEVVSRLQCAHEAADETECVSTMGCCWDPNCLSGFNPDGRGQNAQPEDVLTKADQKASVPPIAFVRRGSGFCCYPNLRALQTLDLLDSPAGLAWDARDGSIYVAQHRAHRVVKLIVADSQCAADPLLC